MILSKKISDINQVELQILAELAKKTSKQSKANIYLSVRRKCPGVDDMFELAGAGCHCGYVIAWDK